MERRLSALLVADIVGSTPAMEANEEQALRSNNACLDIMTRCIVAHEGRVFATAGDSILAEFSSPVNALQAAVDARSSVAQDDACGDIVIRIGLHLADVVVQGTDLRGDGVNIAARIQTNAAPGAIDVSTPFFDQVKRISPCVFDDMGAQQFKGVSHPMQIYRVRTASDRNRHGIVPTTSPQSAEKRPGSVLVAPFRVASSADEDQKFLVEGLTDDLTLELSRMHGIFVLSRSAADANTSTDPVSIGDALGVEYVLSGSIRKTGSRLRFNISLTETAQGQIIWADRMQGDFDEVFDMMDEITARVTATVAGRIEHTVLRAARLKRPENMSAYECYLRAIDLHRLGGVTDRHVVEALEWYDKALALDPNFGRIYAMRVCTASYLPDFNIEKAERDTARALELDPTDPEAHRIMGIIKLKNHGDFEASRYHHERAVQLAPNDAYILGRCAAFHTFAGAPDAAMDLLDKAGQLDPFLPVWVTEERCAAHYASGLYDQVLLAGGALEHQTRRSRIYQAASLVALGREEEAKAQISAAMAEDSTLSGDYIVSQELFQDKAMLAQLVTRAHAAGLPLGAAKALQPLAVAGG
ncbi:adenylate/guanylate cyclase domain-containing protein [Roseobacter ponti]|uniref:Adenylate/guanylate cyclase domain-containing protein n=1 Tax=Roseobacter ponti TaxID=1891787 RepID=A0A858SSF2_9RHOB|nr:adenylate/guanylate cyclase domain-containing protein [Roseobacter ponti]QJF51634.1 adenylate/guanylate cyclase domain-containing protein [Roseobacter ponti]